MNFNGKLGMHESTFSNGMARSIDSFSCKISTLVLNIVFHPYYFTGRNSPIKILIKI